MCHKYHVKHTLKQCNLNCLKSGLKRDTNETPTCAVPMHAPTDKRSLVRGGGGYNQDSFVYLAKTCGGWGTHVMRTLHEEANAKPRANICAKKNKSCVGSCGCGGVGVQREVGVRCCCMQGCCVVWVRGRV